LRTFGGDENALNFVREFFEQGKPVAVICHGAEGEHAKQKASVHADATPS